MKTKGFTMIELVATMAIMLIVALTISTVLSSNIRINKTIGSKISAKESLKDANNQLFSDIRKSKQVTDAVLSGAKWSLPGTNMEYNNNYCESKGYRPLIFFESVSGNKGYYVYSKSARELRKITIPVDTTTTKVTKYTPNKDTMDGTDKGPQWEFMNDDQILEYSSKTSTITNEVVYNNLTIKYNGINYENFQFIGAYKKDPVNIAVLKCLNTNAEGKLPWIIVNIVPKDFTYYAKTRDDIVCRYIKNDGISFVRNLDSSSSGNNGVYYDIHIETMKESTVDVVDTRVSLMDFGGDIK